MMKNKKNPLSDLFQLKTNEEITEVTDDFDFFDRPSEQGTAFQNHPLASYCTEREKNNQGRVRSDNPARYEYEGLYFRTDTSEPLLYKAAKGLDLLVFPLAVAIQGKSGRRIEPDILIIKDSWSMVIEADGESHNSIPAKREWDRLKMFQDNLVLIRRYSVPENPTINWAYECIQDALAYLEKVKTAQVSRNLLFQQNFKFKEFKNYED
tara:strand:- start:3284 stop:3910 length:627 start_codon:yes stop_codon:yes gene_type:complete